MLLSDSFSKCLIEKSTQNIVFYKVFELREFITQLICAIRFSFKLGQFSDIHDHDIPWGAAVDKTLRKYFDQLHIPVLTNLPFGHTLEQFPLVIGSNARLQGNQIDFTL